MTIARSRVLAAAVAGLLSGACSGGPQLPALPVSLPVADLSNLSVPSLIHEPSQLALPSAEVYSRIARGANACWFGAGGRLARSHIFHADAAPSMNGGGVEIVVHERAVDQPKPWGYKAFRVLLSESSGLDGTPGAGGTRLTVENVRIPDAEAARMRAEVFQWATGTEGCKSDPALDPPVQAVSAAPSVAVVPPKATAKGRSAVGTPAAATK